MIELLVGPIASGKSTIAQNRAKQGALIVNDDAIVNACHAGINTLYDYCCKPLYKLIEYNIIHYGSILGIDIVIDRPNMSLGTRSRYIEIARSLDTPISAILMPFTTKEEHINRRMQNDRGYTKEHWEKVWDRMMKDYIPPSTSEGFDFIWTLEKLLQI